MVEPVDVAWRAAAARALPAASMTPASSTTGRAAQPDPAALSTETCVLLLADIDAGYRLWGWSRLVRGPGALRAVPGLRWARLLGSGHDGGFGLRPSASRQGLFCVFDDPASAQAFARHAPLVHAYRERARELLLMTLAAYSVRGRWSGRPLRPAATPPPADAPLVALTRASIRIAAALRFWRHAAPSQQALAGAAGCRLAAGLGEAPLLRQCTVSLWDSAAAMDAYARQGPHQAAIRASHTERHFSESMFVRFAPLSVEGTWKGAVFHRPATR